MSGREMDDCERDAMIDSMRCRRDEPTEYVPPPHGTKWRIFRAIGMLPIESNDKAILSLIVDHANPNGSMKIPHVRWSARAVLLVMADRHKTAKELRRQMWEFKIPTIVWREEMADLQITVAEDGRLCLPPKVAVIPPPRLVRSNAA